MKCEGCSGEVREGEELSRVFTVPAYLHTQEGREEVDTHRYIETPVEEGKKRNDRSTTAAERRRRAAD